MYGVSDANGALATARKDELPALTPQQLHKLRKLTVVSLAHRHKVRRRVRKYAWIVQ